MSLENDLIPHGPYKIVSSSCNSVYLGAYHPGFEGKRQEIQACKEVFYNDR